MGVIMDSVACPKKIKDSKRIAKLRWL